MNLKIVYDNETLEEGTRSGWGFSCLIQMEGRRNVLFDTGADGDTLLHNMNVLGVEIERIVAIAISHEHWDHTGGLSAILNAKQEQGQGKNLPVYVPKSFSNSLKKEITLASGRDLIEVSEPRKIFNGIYTTGELGRGIKEQSLVLEGKKGLFVITGCAHPGLKAILSAASKFGDVYGIIGGFHGFSELDLLKDLKLLVPCHCTVHKSEILRRFPDTSLTDGVGWGMEI
jgi:7,8-dihydropterin-6-yl-methyl-4-(beta-D-ribofuranosyl)aminobenzene 5'-phosphate synthase